MHPIDLVKVHFEPGQLGLLNICLGFLMFGIALDLDLQGFRHLLQQPKAAIIGLLVQYIFFPLLTLALVYVFQPPPSVALGMALVAACPSGNVANYATHLAKANVPLSISLGAVITICAWFTTPAVFSGLSSLMPESTAALARSFTLSPMDMIAKIVQLIVLPMALGIGLQKIAPQLVQKIKKPISWLSLLLFFGLIVGAILSNLQNIRLHLHHVFLLVLVQNGVALASGYFFAAMAKLPKEDRRTLAFESGVHNTGLGLILIFNFFDGLGGMAMIAAWYGIWDMLTVLLLATWYKRRKSL